MEAGSWRRSAGPVQEIIDYVRRAQAEWHVPSVAVGVLHCDKVLVQQDDLGEDTRWGLGSLTKIFTSAAAAALVDDGKLAWEAPVRELLPGFRVADPYVTRELTLRDVLCHRSGARDEPLLYTGTTLSAPELLERAAGLEQKVSFRSSFVYNNLMYLAAGAILERVSGQAYEELLRERFLAPLEMRQTRLGGPRAPGYALIDGQPVLLPSGVGDLDAVYPASGLRATLTDLLKWTGFQLHKGKAGKAQLLRADTLHELHDMQIVCSQARALLPAPHFGGYGYGWYVGDHNGRKTLLGGGRLAGVCAELVVVPEERLGVVVLANLDMTMMSCAVAWEIVDIVLGSPRHDWSAKMLKRVKAEEPPPAGDGTAGEIVEGRYAHPLYGELRVDSAGLYYNRELHGRLEHLEGDTFRLRSAENPLLDGRGVRVRFLPEGVEVAFPVPHHRHLERVLFSGCGARP